MMNSKRKPVPDAPMTRGDGSRERAFAILARLIVRRYLQDKLNQGIDQGDRECAGPGLEESSHDL